MRRQRVRALVLGGGPAGCAVAIALRRHGVASVLVVEAGHYDQRKVGETIPPEARPVLQELGIWDALEQEEHEVCPGSRSIWGSPTPGFNDFLFNPHGNGRHLDRRRFDAFLAEHARAAGAEVRTGTRFVDQERNGNGFLITLRGSGAVEQIEADFVVDATGMRSAFARRQGAERRILDHLVFVYGSFELPDAVRFPRSTLLEAVEHGWWYAARLPEQRIVVALASDAERVREQRLRAPERWLRELRATAGLWKDIEPCRFLEDSMLTAPTASFVLDRVAGPAWLAVGDAASAFDPISGQGIHKALATGIEASDPIVAYLEGDHGPLAEYEAKVKKRFEAYQKLRDHFYGQEQRWPSSAFWQRRRASASSFSDVSSGQAEEAVVDRA